MLTAKQRSNVQKEKANQVLTAILRNATSHAILQQRLLEFMVAGVPYKSIGARHFSDIIKETGITGYSVFELTDLIQAEYVKVRVYHKEYVERLEYIYYSDNFYNLNNIINNGYNYVSFAYMVTLLHYCIIELKALEK